MTWLASLKDYPSSRSAAISGWSSCDHHRSTDSASAEMLFMFEKCCCIGKYAKQSYFCRSWFVLLWKCGGRGIVLSCLVLSPGVFVATIRYRLWEIPGSRSLCFTISILDSHSFTSSLLDSHSFTVSLLDSHSFTISLLDSHSFTISLLDSHSFTVSLLDSHSLLFIY